MPPCIRATTPLLRPRVATPLRRSISALVGPYLVSCCALLASCTVTAGDAGTASAGESCVDLSTWASQCFADELAGPVTARGWDTISDRFDPEVPDIAVRISAEGLLESIEGLPCEFACDGFPGHSPRLEGTYQPIEGYVFETCETYYHCGGYPVEFAIRGADTNDEWSGGALWKIHTPLHSDHYEGAPFPNSETWNVGSADVPYEGCVTLCVSEGAKCGKDGCGGTCGDCPGWDYCDPDTRECVESSICSSDADCDPGETCDTYVGSCIDPGACTGAGSSCEKTSCCEGSTCVLVEGVSECLSDCTAPGQCQSGCCLPTQGGGSVCAHAEACAHCAGSNEACSPASNPCCPGMACIFIDGLGARCQTQQAGCPAGCENPGGSSCCRPPFCAGDCVGSPCCN